MDSITSDTEVTSVTFMSYNSTGLSSVKCRWICDICDEFDVDYLSLQEHFKKTNSIDKYFRDNFKNYNSYIVPGYRPPGQDSGRCKAGLAQLSRGIYSVKKDRVTTRGFRLQAQILNMPTCKVLWLNTYMPTDPRRLTEYDDFELREVLVEVEAIISSNSYTDIVWGGDMNWDMSRVTYFARTMSAFVERLGLVSLWSRYPVSYTYMHNDNKSKSVLDHFLISQRLLDLVEDCGVVERGDNLSGHSPIWVKLRLGSLPKKQKYSGWVPRKPSWGKATHDQVSLYTSTLEQKLHSLHAPLPALSCKDPKCTNKDHSDLRDSFMLDILLSLVESSYTTLPLSAGSGGGGHGGRGRAAPIPGWQTVEPFRKQAVYWYGVWVKERRPTTGWLHDTMLKWKRQFHYAVRRAKGKSNRVRAEKLFEAAMTGDMNLLKEMKKIRNGGGGKKVDLPGNVANADGEEEIVDKFREVYAALYSSAGSEEDMENLKVRVQHMIGNNSVQEVSKVTGLVVKQAALNLKPGKGDVTGGFCSNAIINAPDILFEHIAAIYRSFLFHGTVTSSLLACSFLPLLKSSLKDPTDTGSYRAIAGSSLFLKLFDKVILSVWGYLLSSDSLQFGFKKRTSTTQCSWLVSEVVQHYLRNGSNPIVTVLDCSKAFDTCKFSTLFSCVLEKGVPAIVVRAMMTVYQEQFAWVSWGKAKSELFQILNGTRQGSVASPVLWSLYCDPLIQELRQLGVGAHVGGLFMGVTMYADDLLLVAPTRGAMQQMLDICDSFALRFNVQFSTDPTPSKSKSKCIYMVGKKKNLVKPAPLRLGDMMLPWVETASHLGHELHESGSMEHDAKIKKAEFISSSIEIRETFKFASPVEVLKATKVYCSSFYGCMLWDLGGAGAGQVFNAWNTAIKLAWDCPRDSRSYLVQQVLGCGLSSAKTDILLRYNQFFKSLRVSPSKEVATMANLVSRDVQSTTGANIRMIEELTGLSVWTTGQDRMKAALQDYEKVPVAENDEWRISYLNKLLGYKQQLSYLGEEVGALCDQIKSLCIN